MTEKRDLNEAELQGLFDAAIRTAPVAGGGLVTRMLEDAEAVDADRQAASLLRGSEAQSSGLITQFLEMLGGWPSVAGLATAAVAGVTFGLFSPDSVSAFTGGYLAEETTYDLYDLVPDLEGVLALEEG